MARIILKPSARPRIVTRAVRINRITPAMLRGMATSKKKKMA